MIVLKFAGALVFLALVAGLASCDRTEEDPSQVVTPAITDAAGAASFTPTPQASPTPAPSGEPSATPTGWTRYSDPDARFSLHYPAAWYVKDGASSAVRPPGELTSIFYSFDPGDVAEFPSDGLKIDLYVRAPKAGDDCRSLPDDAVSSMLDGVLGWQKTTEELAEGDGRSVSVAAYSEGYCYWLKAYFGPNNTDDGAFSDILNRFDFTGSTQ